eukprot:TRINITY_DN6378_c0_g1_i1.p1 TRINITY_DN6378_c0_g1~~TRINITY_DN6378_c0_g1_i1.p1  ORF type:complete len:452 (+),score=116.96 TRINITY_DN6378_c0_g1_i1:136-1491(+)
MSATHDLAHSQHEAATGLPSLSQNGVQPSLPLHMALGGHAGLTSASNPTATAIITPGPESPPQPRSLAEMVFGSDMTSAQTTVGSTAPSHNFPKPISNSVPPPVNDSAPLPSFHPSPSPLLQDSTSQPPGPLHAVSLATLADLHPSLSSKDPAPPDATIGSQINAAIDAATSAFQVEPGQPTPVSPTTLAAMNPVPSPLKPPAPPPIDPAQAAFGYAPPPRADDLLASLDNLTFSPQLDADKTGPPTMQPLRTHDNSLTATAHDVNLLPMPDAAADANANADAALGLPRPAEAKVAGQQTANNSALRGKPSMPATDAQGTSTGTGGVERPLHAVCTSATVNAPAPPPNAKVKMSNRMRRAHEREIMTPLHAAAGNGHVATAEMLVNVGAIINVKDHNKCTPLHLACMNGHPETAKMLVAKGANIKLKNKEGKTPLDYCSEELRRELKRIKK